MSDPTTRPDLDALEQLANAAADYISYDHGPGYYADRTAEPECKAFYAPGHTALPALVAEVRRLEGLLLMVRVERDAAVQRAERAESDRLAEVEGLTAERDHYRAAVRAAEAATAARIAAFIEDGGPEWVTDDLLFALRAGAWRGKGAP
jgi:hypothetical protein